MTECHSALRPFRDFVRAVGVGSLGGGGVHHVSGVISGEDVVSGVLTTIQEDGPVPPTARRLAAALHVAPATLYSSVASLPAAYSRARSELVAQFARPLLEALTDNSVTTLAKEFLSSPGCAVFVTDPTWTLESHPMIANALKRAGLPAQALSDLLAMMGAAFTYESLGAGDIDTGMMTRLVDAYGKATELTEGSGSVGDTYIISSGDVSAVAEVAHELIDDAVGDSDKRVARMANISILTGQSSAAWSFRELEEVTGIPSTRLHRYGTRHWHVSMAWSDLLQALALWAQKESRGAKDALEASIARQIAFLLQHGDGEALVRLYQSERVGGRLDTHRSEPSDSATDELPSISRPLAALALSRRAEPDVAATSRLVAGVYSALHAA